MWRYAPCFVFLIGCNLGIGSMPSWEGYEARMKLLEGRPVNEVIDEWGPPTEVLDAAAGNQLFVWETKHSYKTPDRVQIETSADGRRAVGQVDRGVEVGVECKTTLRANADGIIESATAQGAGCLATMPDAPARPAQANAPTASPQRSRRPGKARRDQ